MERKIGEIFEYNGEWYQCVEDSLNNCVNCCFYNGGNKKCSDDEIGECSKGCRSDNYGVYFKKLEKVGEPFSCNYYGDARLIMMQEYQLFGANVIYSYSMPPMYITDYKHNRIAIEITEKKEGMEVCKMQDAREDIPEFDKVVDECLFGEDKPKLKPFSLEAAKAGKPVCTRDGRSVRIICFDKKCLHEQVLIALVDRGKEESIYFYTTDGKCIDDFSSFDLMMLPEKKEGWVNVYKDSVYDSKEEALAGKSESRGYIDTIKVSWEE